MSTRTALFFLLLTGLVLAGCSHSRTSRATIPTPPPELPSLPPPPTVGQIDAGIHARQSELARLSALPRPVLTPGQPLSDVDREIQERTTRIEFLRGEIDALVQQRKASELYYRDRPAEAAPAFASAEISGAAAPPTPAVVDERIKLRQAWASRLFGKLQRTSDGDDDAALDRQERELKTRIEFLRGEIDALVAQRKASEIYYRQPPAPK